MALFDEIREMIAEALAIEEEEVVKEAHLQDDLLADSLALLNLAEAIGERYGIEIQGDDLVEAETVGALLKFVEAGIAAKS